MPEPTQVRAIPAPDAHVAYGYTMADLARLARVGVSLARTAAGPGDERYVAAWDGVVLHLAEAPGRPSERELAGVAASAVEAVRAAERHHHGVSSRGTAAPRHAVYWLDYAVPAPSPERAVVDRLSLAQIWARLSDGDRQAIAALATCGDYATAAGALGVTYRAFTNRIRYARTAYLALWHEGETPSRLWRADRRDQKTPQWENKNRTDLLRRQSAVGQRRLPGHGWYRYCYYRCRCEVCKEAARVRNRATYLRRHPESAAGQPRGRKAVAG